MKTILVLEDDDILREVLVDVLDSLDYCVEGAACPEEALHLAQELVFDLVIADIRMAGPVDGLQVLQQLKERRPALRCLVMTGYADEMAPVRALQISVDDYLYKPFAVQDILAALERIKNTAQRQVWYRRTLARLLGQTNLVQVIAQLQNMRETCLQDFFVAVRSNLIYAETALDAWDNLEKLELHYLQIMRSPSSITVTTACSLCQDYANWKKQLSQRVAQQDLVMSRQRSADKVSRTQFRCFFERIKNGELHYAELALAVCLRKMPADHRAQDVEYQQLWLRIWG